jgi:hypothetical protein
MTTPAPVPFADTSALLANLESEFAFATLTGNDRCDADSAEAAVAQVLMGDTVLLFCGSHWRKFSEGDNGLAKFPHSVPEEESKPFTERRAQELGLAANRNKGDEHA